MYNIRLSVAPVNSTIVVTIAMETIRDTEALLIPLLTRLYTTHVINKEPARLPSMYISNTPF